MRTVTHREMHGQLRPARRLAVALRVGCDELVTYDGELATAARAAGLLVLSPAP